MWLLSTCGFYSVVAHRDNNDTLIVRARVREDLEELRRGYLPDLEIVEGGGSDYQFRAFVSRMEWEHAVRRMAAHIDYPNFKDAIDERQGNSRAELYGRLWQLLGELGG
jgi:hypothetical protein